MENELGIKELNKMNLCVKGVNSNIRYFLRDIIGINLLEGYTKGNHFIYNGNMEIENNLYNVGVEGTNKTITKFKIFY